jgi:hypothetical protein
MAADSSETVLFPVITGDDDNVSGGHSFVALTIDVPMTFIL